MLTAQIEWEWRSDKIERWVARWQDDELPRVGRAIMQFAQRSMHRRRGKSPPGSPPRSHRGQLRDLIRYEYDPLHGCVVVGPVVWSDVPAVHEHGGTLWVWSDGARVLAAYPARPYLRPALRRALAWWRLRAAGRGWRCANER